MTRLTQERLKELLWYDPIAGIFVWKVDKRGFVSRSGVSAGEIAGQVTGNGYRYIGIDGDKYKASRLAWLYMTGKWPSADIDHKNKVKTDDRFANLRSASRQENMANRRGWSKSGFKGVREHKPGRFSALITVNGKQKHLGVFDTPENAHKAYVNAAAKSFGAFSEGESA